MKTINRFLIVVMTAALVSCGENTELPPERPFGNITGYAIDSAIEGGTVAVYSFADGVRGEHLASATTDAAGVFNVEIQAPTQFVMVEVTGGSYVEEASGTTVSLAEGQNLRSIVNYESGQTVSTNITPLTHMATALAEFKVSGGNAVAQAVNESFATIDKFFKVSSRGTTSLNIAVDNTVNTLNEEARYGFYLAGISHWTGWASQKAGLAPHTNYTSIGLAKTLYNDIRHDGVMDGMGSDDNNDEQAKVFATVPLSADEYRLMFTVHAIAVGLGENNKTEIDVANETIKTQLEEIADTQGEDSPLLPADAQAVDIGNLDITVTVDPSEYSGVYGQQYSFTVQVDSLVGAERIWVYLDEDPNQPTPPEPVYTITRQQAPVALLNLPEDIVNGTHTIYVVAEDIFGGTSAPASFSVSIDTTMPSIAFDASPYLTNSANTTLTGTFNDNLAGVQSITVQGVQAQLTYVSEDSTTSGQWSVDLQDLNPGATLLTAEVTDIAGNSNVLVDIETVYLDDQLPTIEQSTPNGHSDALFSGGSVTDPLEDENGVSKPLFIETNKILDYAGGDTTTDYTTAGIPYFRFTVYDLRAPGIYTDTGLISTNISIKYAKTEGGMEVVFPAEDNVAKIEDCSSIANECEYLVPLTAPNLPNDWDQATPTDQHVILVQVTDGAGNVQEKQFSFYADFVVPDIPLCIDQSCTQGELVVTDLDPFAQYDGANFVNRQELYGVNLETTQYTFTNPSDKSIYIRFEDATEHTVSQLIAEWRRIHEVQKTTLYAWQVQTMYTAASTCPTPSGWTDVDYVYNYTDSGWVMLNVPQSITENVFVNQENFPENGERGWLPMPHFDDVFKTGNIDASSPPRTWSFVYDYVTELPVIDIGFVAYLNNWQYEQGGSQPETCDPVERYFLRDNELYEYEWISDPEDIETDLPAVNLPFSTTDFIVKNGLEEIQSTLSGFYLIPASATVSITKTTTTPILDYYENPFNSPASYTNPVLRDKTITWSVDKRLHIFSIHNTGESNLQTMSERETVSNTGVQSYTISRTP